MAWIIFKTGPLLKWHSLKYLTPMRIKTSFLFIICQLTFLAVFSQSKTMVVAQDGTGNYKTVQEAFNAIPDNNQENTSIYIKNGTYKEKLTLGPGKNLVTLKGEDKYKTILTFDDHTGKVTPGGDTINTNTSASFVVKANNFTAENITFQNDAGFTAGQAVGLEVQGDKAFINNCRIIGNQDILFTSSAQSRQYYKNCYIEGTTDFIFGAATVWFEQCHIHSKKESHVTAASTPKDHPFGYIFNDCILTGDTTLHNVSLGRPWRPYSSVIYIHCYMGSHIKGEGWANWNKTDYYKTARYAEYENFGPGAGSTGRISWSKQLTHNAVKLINPPQVLGGWIPGAIPPAHQH